MVLISIEGGRNRVNFTDCFFDFDLVCRFHGRVEEATETFISASKESENRKIGKESGEKLSEARQLTDLSTWMTPSTNEPARCLPFQPKRRLSVCPSPSPLLPYLSLSLPPFLSSPVLRHLPDNTRDYSRRIARAH